MDGPREVLALDDDLGPDDLNAALHGLLDELVTAAGDEIPDDTDRADPTRADLWTEFASL